MKEVKSALAIEIWIGFRLKVWEGLSEGTI
jgi:hypothetical protein